MKNNKANRPSPMIHLNAYDWPNLKEHKVGDKVQLIIEAEITGMNKESDYYFDGPMEDGEKRPKILRGSMEIKSIKDKEFKNFEEEKAYRLSKRNK